MESTDIRNLQVLHAVYASHVSPVALCVTCLITPSSLSLQLEEIRAPAKKL